MEGKKVLKGFFWTYGSQIVSNLIQFAYAALTARIINSSGFGSYALALTTSSLISLIANGGLAQSASRLRDVTSDDAKRLQTYALVSGFTASIFTFFSADFWAFVWNSDQVAPSMRILSFGVLLGPFAVLASGVTRRNGYYRFNGIAMLLTNLVGMAVGAVCVAYSRQSWSLLVSPLVAQLLLTIALNVRSRNQLFGFRKLGRSKDFSGYNMNIILAKVATYFVSNLPTWTFSKFFGVGVVGDVNRAGVFTTVPLYQVQTAMVQAVSPEFRHDIESPTRAKKVWSDLLVLISWFAFPVSFVVAAVGFFLLPVILGPGWSRAAIFTFPLALTAGVQILATVLDSGVEVIGNFKVFWYSLAAAFVPTLVLSILAVALDDYGLVFLGIFLSQVGMHTLQLIGSKRRGYIDLRKIVRGYAESFAYSAVLGLSLLTIFSWLLGKSIELGWAITAGSVLVVQLVLCIVFFARLTPVNILKTYNIGSFFKATTN